MLENKVRMPEINYGDEVRRLSAMCQDETLAEQVLQVIMRFHVEPNARAAVIPGWRRRKTLFLADRVVAAADALGLTYTFFQDPESEYWDPVFVLVTSAKTWLLLEFYKALQDR